MTTSEDKDLWLEVLAGRAQPTDHATRQASQAGEVYRRLAQPEPDPALEDRLLARIGKINADLAQPVQVAQAEQAVPGGLLQRLMAWFSADAGSPPLRFAGSALAVVGLAVVVVGAMRGGDDAEHEQMKAPPAMSTPPASGAHQIGAAPGQPTLTLVDTQPLARATALQSALKTLGVNAEVMPLGDAARLEAQVSPEQEDAVKALLQRESLAWPGGAGLAIVVKSAP